jgi:hypothetical protein
MWVKRTPEEIAKAKRKNLAGRIRLAVFMGVFVSAPCTFVYGSRAHTPGFFVPLDQIVSRVPSSIVLGAIVGIMTYWFALRDDRKLICPNCGKTKFKDTILQCSCGGHFENAEEMKWTGKK